jgi:hypothetical protein
MAKMWRRAIQKYGSLGAISFEKAFSTDLRRNVMGPEIARNLPPIYLLYFTETAVYSAHYQSICLLFLSLSLLLLLMSLMVLSTNQRNRLESIPE